MYLIKSGIPMKWESMSWIIIRTMYAMRAVNICTRIKTAMKNLDPLIQEAVSSIKIIPRPGHPHSLTLEQRVKLILVKQLVGESNRMFANMLAVFSMLVHV